MSEKREISYVVAVSNAIEGKLDAETVAKLEKLKASLEKRSAKSGKPTKAQIANAELAEKIAAAMEPDVEYAIADIRELLPDELGKAPSQKIAPLMAKLAKAGKVIKTEAKGKVTYRLA